MFRKRVGQLLSLLCSLSALGCVETSVGVSKGTPLPQFLAISRSYKAGGYRLSPGDQLTTRFYYNPQLDEDVQIRPDGHVSLSLVGEVMAAGKTTTELAAEVSQAYAKYFTKPSATIIVREFTGYRVFTSGQLRYPGQVSLVAGASTVLESLAISGGVTDEGTLTHVMLVRRLPTQREPMIAELDLAAALSGSDLSQDVELLPNDLIYVPRSGAADLNLAMQQYLFNNLNLTTGVGATTGWSLNQITRDDAAANSTRTQQAGRGTVITPPPTTTPTPMTPTQTTPVPGGGIR